MNGVRSEKENMVKNVVMNGVKSGKVGKLEYYKSDEGMLSQSEERLCRSIIKGLARRNYERRAMLADVEEEQEQDVICFDDVTGKELPWHAVRKARELELKYLRDFGVHEKVDEKEAVEKYGVTPVDTKWVDTDKAWWSQCKSDHECVRESSKVMTGQTCVQGLLRWRLCRLLYRLQRTTKETFSIMHIDVSRAYFHAKAQRPVLIRLPAEDRMGTDAGKIGLMKKSMYGTRDGARLAGACQEMGISTWTQLEEPVSPQRESSFRADTWRRLRAHWANKETDGI